MTRPCYHRHATVQKLSERHRERMRPSPFYAHLHRLRAELEARRCAYREMEEERARAAIAHVEARFAQADAPRAAAPPEPPAWRRRLLAMWPPYAWPIPVQIAAVLAIMLAVALLPWLSTAR